MATQSAASAQTPDKTNLFYKGMVKDYADLFVSEGLWTHARNAVNTTHRGDAGVLGNEPGNELLASAPYQVVGVVHRSDSSWVVFSTDEQHSEIGLFDEHLQTYTPVVNSPCLGLSANYPVTGVVKSNADTTHTVYFQDNRNPDRCLNLNAIPYRTTGRNLGTGDCFIPEYTSELDCEKILLHPLLTVPRLVARKSNALGQLPNGSYQAVVAYSVNGIRVTDYFTPSAPVSIWDHAGTGGAIEINLSGLDEEFDEYELVIVSVTNQQTQAKRIGYYSIRQNVVVLDQYQQSLPTVELALIPLQNPIYHRSEGIYELNGFLLRKGVSTRPDFNYQQLANQITTQWVGVQYPADYYHASGVNVGHMRDEVYSYFIRWVYDTSLKSASYHIPGRAASAGDLSIVSGANTLPGETQAWQVNDTATYQEASGTTADGGLIVAKGTMQYWESLERYPDNKPLVWGELCGKPIRHHKFPSNETIHHHTQGGDSIVVLGVEFGNIAHPVDEQGRPLTDIVGYEILRGSREGNRSIIAKGLFNNLVEYTLPGNGSTKGLYQNYPYNDLRPDKFLTSRATTFPGRADAEDELEPVPASAFKLDQLSFHSPDTSFNKPFLSGAHLRLYTEQSGTVTGAFDYVDKHPKEKLITNFAFAQAAIVGVGIAILESIGEGHMMTSVSEEASVIVAGASSTQEWARGGGIATAIPDTIANLVMSPATTASGVAIMLTAGRWFTGMGIDQALSLVYKISPARQYALQYNSHAFFNTYQNIGATSRRRQIPLGGLKYIGQNVQDFTATHRINNWGRTPYVALQLNTPIAAPTVQDNSRQRIKDLSQHTSPTREFRTTASSFYGALKVPSTRQYGQIDAISQLPTDSGVLASSPAARSSSGVLFGGDVYITRYTEKNPYLYFNTWLRDLPDMSEYDYRLGLNGPTPRYWANFERFDMGGMGFNLHINKKGKKDPDDDFTFLNGRIGVDVGTPSDMHHLDRDRKVDVGALYSVRDAYFYLFNNGVRDFFVESEMNMAFRDYGENPGEKHYNPYEGFTDLQTLFRSDLIKSQELLKYDNSLSASKLYQNFISWGRVLPRDFDPLTNTSRYSYFPDRVLYSLQHQAGLKRDNWKSWLANNYKDLSGQVSTIKALNGTGAVILFENAEPVQFVGVDQLQTKAGTKITIGDGGLFQQNMQSMVNADDALEYGSCQSKLSAVNTPHGLFWISQKAGKIFNFVGQARDITQQGMSRWFAENLPSRLLRQFPDFALADNTLVGVGCATVYDPMYELVYFSKRDFEVLPDYRSQVRYRKGEGFYLVDAEEPTLETEIELGDPLYFEDCSWTVSYDPVGMEGKPCWVSFHDWVPALSVPTYQHFVTVKQNAFYRHNSSTTSFASYYGVDYPWEVEVPVVSPGVAIVRSIEYVLECYQYSSQGRNQYHLLDENFDRAMLYNSEQHSGQLRLNPMPKNNPYQRLQYPKVTPTGIDILVSKEENKYRFNQFWDATRDRGEFTGRRTPLWLHEGNGYKQRLNPQAVDYQKPLTERKKLRHYGNRLLLKKLRSGDVKMILKLTTTKITPSPR